MARRLLLVRLLGFRKASASIKKGRASAAFFYAGRGRQLLFHPEQFPSSYKKAEHTMYVLLFYKC